MFNRKKNESCKVVLIMFSPQYGDTPFHTAARYAIFSFLVISFIIFTFFMIIIVIKMIIMVTMITSGMVTLE